MKTTLISSLKDTLLTRPADIKERHSRRSKPAIQAGAINVQELENGVIQVVCGRNQLGAVAESLTQFGIRPYDHLVMSNRNKLSAGVRKTIERSYVYALTAAVGTSPYLYYLLTTSSSTGQSMDKISMAVAGLWFGSMVGGIVVPK
ncbi:unnamed protein product, partial [Aphanomyces euteiches]